MMKKVTVKQLMLLSLFVAIAWSAGAQLKVGDNPNTINTNSIIEMETVNKGILFPRVALVQTTDPAPMTSHVKGMQVYNTANVNDVVEGVYSNDGSKWLRVEYNVDRKLLYGWGVPTLACQPDAIYTDTLKTSSTLGKMWICRNGTWISYMPTTQTPFYMNGSTNDAGGNKSGNIYRHSSISILNPNNERSSVLGADGGIELYRTNAATAWTPAVNGYIDFKYNQAHDVDVRLYYSQNNNKSFVIEYNPNGEFDGSTKNNFILRNDLGYLGIGGIMPTVPVHLANGAHCNAAGVWTNASDIRLKTNIVGSSYGLADVLKLRPVQYEMKSNGAKQVGFIAQEVRDIVPEVVSGTEGNIEKGEILGLSYGSLVPVLTKAIQEQQTQIAAQQQEIAELKSLVQQLLEKK